MSLVRRRRAYVVPYRIELTGTMEVAATSPDEAKTEVRRMLQMGETVGETKKVHVIEAFPKASQS